ncbi:MAG: hypothetical protein ABIO37_17860 [Caulobacteraceae bacterium]
MSDMIKILSAAFVLLLGTSAAAEPTRVMVRAQAQDAKFIGDHMGGVEITLTDAKTGKVLAKGLTKGGAGDTPRIMRTPRSRRDQIADAATAGFETTLDLTEPTLIRADAAGPIGKPRSSIKVSSSLWVIPGRDVLGDGWVLAFPGLVIEPTATVAADGVLQLQAQVSLMCGCPIEAGGLWDAANYKVSATLLQRGKIISQTALTFTGRTGEFAATTPRPRSGRYIVRVVATDTKTSNAGVVEQPIRVAN